MIKGFSNVSHPDYDDSDHIEVMGAISCNFMSRFLPESVLIERYTIGYPYICIPKEKMAAYIDMLMTPPAVDIGLTFSPFSFQTEPGFEFFSSYILAEPEYLTTQFEVYFEESDTAPLSWYENYLDLTLAARFLPLLKAHDGTLLAHGSHFETFLDYVAQHADFAALLSQPSGPHRDLLRLHYDMLPNHVSMDRA